MSNAKESDKAFRIFRAADAPLLSETECMTIEPFTSSILPILGKLQEAGYRDGGKTRVLVNMPGFSLAHVWFKKDYPLALHSHDSDCLYYIIAGSLKLGTEELGPRDSFFVPGDAPYTYRPGPDGVELLEFRHATHFNFVNHAKGEAFWTKALETVKASHDSWVTAKMPALNS